MSTPTHSSTTEPTTSFDIASQLKDYAIQAVQLSDRLQTFLGGFIKTFDHTTLTLIEGDKPSIKILHKMLHELMVDAIAQGFDIQLIDVANCFDPQLVSTITFETGRNPHEILNKINLARPFQMYQSASIVKTLAKLLKEKRSKAKQLIIMTCVSSQFFDEAMRNEDPKFPIPQLELFRHTLGVLQSLASMGHTIVLTDVIEGKLGPIHRPTSIDEKQTIRIQGSSLAQTAKIRLRLQDGVLDRRVSLLNHPFLSQQISTIRKEEAMIDIAQTSLNDFF